MTVILSIISILALSVPSDPDSRLSGESVTVKLSERLTAASSVHGNNSTRNEARELVRYLPGCVNPVGTSVCDPTPCPDGTIRSTPISVTVPAGAAPPPLGDWVFNAPGCFPPDADTGPVLTDLVIAEAFRGLVTPSVPFIQPATGEALVNLPLVAYAESGVDSWTPLLLGTTVAIRAVPVSYAWDFGDGSGPVVTDDPGAPYPNQTVEHVYTGTGSANITLTTTYTGEYSLDGGSTWVAIPGTASASSPTITVTIVEARAQLTG